MLEILVPLVAFLGIFVGFFLSKICKEEMEPGKKYFLALKNFICIFLGLFMLYVSLPNYTFFIIGMLIGYAIRKEYLYFGVLMLLLRHSLDFTLLASTFIFIYGLQYGTNFKKFRSLFIEVLLFFPPIIAITLLNLNVLAFVNFAAGAIFIQPFVHKIEEISDAHLYKRD